MDKIHKIIRIAIDVPVPGLFDYLAEASSEDIGRRVIVPFGKKQIAGIVLEVGSHSEVPENRLKPAFRIFRENPPLDRNLLDLFRFCSGYYHHPIGSVVMNALPAKLKTLEPLELKQDLFLSLTEAGRMAQPRGRNLNRLLDSLRVNPVLSMNSLRTEFPLPSIRKLLDLGFAEAAPGKPAPIEIAPHPVLNESQHNAVSGILGNLSGFHPWLLFGVTGSGKTEVYLQVISRILQMGRQVLFLVPEINLTPHLEQVFKSRFPGTSIASLHSGLSDTERVQNWLKAQTGQARIVLGTRLAVFTPFFSLGLIVVDEEHDASFKQQEGLRYSARDVAVMRAKRENIPVILGSATPSLESYFSAMKGRYRLLELKTRAVLEARLPEVHFVDLRSEKRHGGLSEKLIKAVSLRLERKEQSLIFINRRGYSPALICSSCSWTPDCKRCSSRLVLHLKEGRLRCHYCGHEEKIVQTCPHCGNLDLKPVGHGTQRIESELLGHFPHARILRIDRDSIRKKKSWNEMLQKIRRGEADILVGTQILAKGHDFPNLTLVGILNPDASLYSSDFRASERLFAQLAQVSGRAGRAGSPGEVLIQTEFIDHPLYVALKHHDYRAMAELLLEERKAAGFPPYVHQALIRAESASIEQAMAFLGHVSAIASNLAGEVTVFDPAPASMARLGNMERAQILFQSPFRKKLQEFLDTLLPGLNSSNRTVRWHVDVDPLEF